MTNLFKLAYGHGEKIIQTPEGLSPAILEPRGFESLSIHDGVLKRALSRPLGREPLAGSSCPQSVAIAVPDSSRPFPTARLLPVLQDFLFMTWPRLKSEAIAIIVGGGLHPPHGPDEIEKLIPPSTTRGCNVMAHDARRSDMKFFGVTTRGTPVSANKIFAEAEMKIVMGQIDPHQFVGFTGGAKGAVVGLGAPETIEQNHSLMFKPGAEAGRLSGNPVREDLTEAGEMIGIDLAVNVVLGPDKNIAWIDAGKPVSVLEQGALICSRLYGVKLDRLYDMAIASCGGHPKDICLYQAQKGLNLASAAVRPGGKILLLAECADGVGDDDYLEYVSRFATAAETMEDFMSGPFRMGAHKAYLFGKTLTRYQVAIDSSLDAATLARCHLTPGRAEDVLAEWIKTSGPAPSVAIIPFANTTYFIRPEDDSI